MSTQYNGQYIKELEESDIIGRFIVHLAKYGINAKLLEHPIMISQILTKGANVPDAVVLIESKRCLIEIITMSSTPDERKEIGKHRKKLIEPTKELRGPVSFQLLFKYFKWSLAQAIKIKCNKNYTEFRAKNDIAQSVLLINIIDNSPFFTYIELADLLSCIRDKHVLDDLGVGNSNFDQIYLGMCVQIESGAWPFEYHCIADSAKTAFLRETWIRRRQLKEKYDNKLILTTHF